VEQTMELVLELVPVSYLALVMLSWQFAFLPDLK
jgi:hypothetical protein